MAPQRVILMSCGSYNPPTNMHLRMFEIARDHLHRMGTHEVIGGVMSPVNDAYVKKELTHSSDRLEMLHLALQSNDWIKLSTWEIRQNVWSRTLASLSHHQNVLNAVLNNSNGSCNCFLKEDTDWIPECVKDINNQTPIQLKLLCGADLLESFAVPNLWLEEDIDKIVGQHGLVVVTREGSDPNKFIYDSDVLSKHMHNIFVVTEWIPNEISSTRIRRALKRGESVKYLLQDSVIDYIYKNRIYGANPISKTKLDLPYNDVNDSLFKDCDMVLAQSPNNVAITPISQMNEFSGSISRCIFDMNIQNSSQAYELNREYFVSEDCKSELNKLFSSSENSNQVPISSVNHNHDFVDTDFSDSPPNINNKLQPDEFFCEEKYSEETSDITLKSNSFKIDIEDSTNVNNVFNQNDQHCLKTETLNSINDDEDSKNNDTNREIDGKYIKSLVNSKKSPKKVSKFEDDSKKCRRKERESRKNSYHSSSFRHRRYRDENSDDETNTIVRSSIAKKPLTRVPSIHKSLIDKTSSHPSIFLQGSLDSINIDAPKTVSSIPFFEINSKKSKSYESIKRNDVPRLSLMNNKADQLNVVSQSDSTSKLITSNDFDLLTEDFCSVCYLPNDPSSADIFYTITSNCSSPGDDDSTKCDICSWNLQVDSDIPEQSLPDSTCETCEICGEPAASFNDNLNQIEEKRSQSLSLLNKLSLRLDEGKGGILKEENIDVNNDGLEKKIERNSHSLTEPHYYQNSVLFVPKDEIAMGKSGKRFSRKGSIVKKVNKFQEKRRYASVENLQYTKYSYKIPGDKLIESKETKYMTSADNIRNSKSFRSKSLRRSVDNIGKYDSSGDNLDSLDANFDKDINGENEIDNNTSKLKSDTIKMILTQHGIKIISGKETVL